MPTPTLRDRFYTPQVARALWSPLGILLAAGGLSIGLVAGIPVAAAVAIGALAYGARVAAAVPKGIDADGVNAFALDDPWRTFVWQAKKAQRQFLDAVKHTHDGPLRDRLNEIADRINTGVDECWQAAQSGQQIAQARARIDITAITTELSQLPTGDPLHANPALADTAKALQAQLDTAKRMDGIIATTQDRLRLLDARLGELVTRVIELSVRPQALEDLQAVGADVDSVVAEMETLRQALDETDTASSSSHTPMMPAFGASGAELAPPMPTPEASPVANMPAILTPQTQPQPQPQSYPPAPPPDSQPATPPRPPA